MTDQLVLRVSLIKDDYCNGCPALGSTGFCRELQRWVDFTSKRFVRPDDCPLECIESLHIG